MFGISSALVGLALNARDLALRRLRERISAYLGIRLFRFPAAIVFAAFITLPHNREPVIQFMGPGNMPETFPYWAVLLVAALMVAAYLRERSHKKVNK